MIKSSKGDCDDISISKINGLVRKALFIPETKKINILFKMMQSQKRHMVIVVDEYGQTSGIIAMEDILEEIVGNILDEYDKEDTDIIRKEDGTFIVRGCTLLDDITHETGIEFDEDCETLNGYLTKKFERVVNNDERPEIVVNNIKFKVINVEKRVITLVHITKINVDKSPQIDN